MSAIPPGPPSVVPSLAPANQPGLAIPAVSIRSVGERPEPDWALLAIAAPTMFAASISFEAAKPIGTWGVSLAAAAAATVVATLLLAVLQVTIFRVRVAGRTPLLVVLGGFAVVGAARGLTAEAVAAPQFGPTSSRVAFHVLVTVIVTTPWLVLVAWALAYSDQARHLLAGLRQEQAGVTQRRRQLETAASRAGQAMAALVDEVASPAITASEELVLQAAHGQSPSPRQLLDVAYQVRDRAETEIRDLSHALDAAPEPSARLTARIEFVAPPERTWAPAGWQWLRRITRLASFSDPFLPAPVAVTTLFLQAALVVWYADVLLTPLALGASTALIYCALWIARSSLLPWIRRQRPVIRVLAVTGVFVTVGWISTLCIALVIIGATMEQDVVLIAVESTAVPVTGWLWAVIASGNRQVVNTERDMAAAISTARLQAAQLEQILLSIQRQAAQIVHSRVQGRFIAAAMMIASEAREIESDPDRKPAATRAALTRAIDVLDLACEDVAEIRARGSRRTQQVAGLLESITGAWHGVLAVSLQVHPEAARVIDDAPGMSDWVCDVVREAVSNAARHGGAQRAEVRIELAAGIQIRVTDDGTGPVSTAPAGLGSAAILRAGGTWTLAQQAKSGGAVLRVCLPLPSVPGPASS